MAITINTNMQALIIRHNLDKATQAMNEAMERISSGLRINSAKDDPAGFSISTRLTAKISSCSVASDNVAMGSKLLDSTEGILDLITNNLSRINDLTEQAANGTYSPEDLKAIAAEVEKRIDVIDRLAQGANFNGIKLLDGTANITLQIGTGANDRLTLDPSIFAAINAGTSLSGLTDAIKAGNTSNTAAFLNTINTEISGMTTRIASIGAAQNQLKSISDWINVQQTNLKATKSTIMDADIAEEVAKYVSAQILQSACATLLIQANMAPKIALTLIEGSSLR